jgi:2-polyprenyl-3-methyl-5-hydroxy-6-metoxy-1,4-benzoquinol methylase
MSQSKSIVPEFEPHRWTISDGGRPFRYLRDRESDIIFCDPLPTPEELSEYYSTSFNYGWYAKRKWLKRVQGWHRWKRVEKRLEKLLGRTGTLLDVGCGHGWFLHAATHSGWNATGLDLPSDATLFAQKTLGLNIIHGSIEQPLHGATRYDVVSMWHSLEHTINPVDALQHAKAMLAPDGLLLIAVPNVKCYGQQLRGIDWVWLQQPFVHLWHFSEKALREILTEAGFAVLHIETRDTWDAQVLYDGVMQQWAEKIFRGVGKAVGFSAKVVGIESHDRLREQIVFLLSESARIIGYTIYLSMRLLLQFFFKKRGSELLIVAKSVLIEKN